MCFEENTVTRAVGIQVARTTPGEGTQTVNEVVSKPSFDALRDLTLSDSVSPDTTLGVVGGTRFTARRVNCAVLNHNCN